MKALIYLIKRTAANNLKKAVRKPTTLLALIFGAAYGIFLIVMLGNTCGYSSDRFCSRTCHSCDGVDDLHYSRKLYVLCFSKRNLVSAGSFSVRISRSDQPQTCFDTGSVDELSDVIFHMDRVGDRRLDGFSCGMVEDAFLLSDRMRRRVCGRTICYDHFIYE